MLEDYKSFEKLLEDYKKFEELIRMNLPECSKIQSIGTKELRGSIYLQVCYEVSDEYQKEYELFYKNRIMDIRLVKGENDEGLPISSCGNRMEVC